MTVKNADALIAVADASARGAISDGIGPPPTINFDTGELSSDTKPRTPKSADSGFETTSPASAGTTPTSEPSEPLTKPSNKHWRKPKDAKGFASQANEVATMILNGEIDLDAARAYSGVSRTMAQVLSAEVYRARFLQQAPDLTFEEET